MEVPMTMHHVPSTTLVRPPEAIQLIETDSSAHLLKFEQL